MSSDSADASSDRANNRVAAYTGFSHGSEYLEALLHTPSNLKNSLTDASFATAQQPPPPPGRVTTPRSHMSSDSADASSDRANNRVAAYTGFSHGSEYLEALLHTPSNLKNRSRPRRGDAVRRVWNIWLERGAVAMLATLSVWALRLRRHSAARCRLGCAWSRPGPTQVEVRKLFRRSNAADLNEDAGKHNRLLPSLTYIDLIGLGVGMMLGAGVFVTTGAVAANHTGPSIVIGFFVAGLSAFLSSFIYSEFTVDLPFAGGAYNFVLCSLGEFCAWVSVSNLLLAYVLANAAIMRAFAPYFASLCNQPTDYFTYQWNGYTIDWFAFAFPLLMTVMLVRGTKSSATVNLIITCTHLTIMSFIIIAGFTQAKSENFTTNFAPFGWREVFNGAAQLFFSFIGFDAVATTAEEVINPHRDLPRGILGSVTIVTIIYILMGAVLCLMVPFNMIDTAVPFTAAFDFVGMSWAKYIVAIGALLGILTGVFVGILGASRMLTSSGRENMLPPFVSFVGKRQTPWVATVIIGGISAIIGLFTSLDGLIDLVSIGILLVFWLVALASIWRRNYVAGVTSTQGVVSSVVHLVVFCALSLTFSVTWVLETGGELNYIYNAVFFVACILVAISMFFCCKPVFTPEKYVCPAFPFVACASLFLNTFLLSQLSESGYITFGYWTVFVVGVYLLYSMPASWVHHRLREKWHAQAIGQEKMEVGSGATSAEVPDKEIPVEVSASATAQ
eukprot:gene22436-29548_t